jgi:DNA-binding response OmpR family regulator
MGRTNEVVSTPPRLDGARVLVVEDDFFIGLELSAILSDAGAVVVGPVQTVQAALATIDDQAFSAAILDIRLGQDTVEPVARLLVEHEVPFLFYTGQSGNDPARAAWPDSKVLTKPALPISLLTAVAALLKKSDLRSLSASG